MSPQTTSYFGGSLPQPPPNVVSVGNQADAASRHGLFQALDALST
ncbi:hypothetical protein [Proteus mirabilis]